MEKLLKVLFFTTIIFSFISAISVKEILNDSKLAVTPFNPFLNKFKCFVNVCEQVAKEYGYEELWKQTDDQLQENFEKWQECAKKGNPIIAYK